MDTIFRNLGNSKISELQRLVLNLLNKINLKRNNASNLSIYCTRQNIENLYTKVRLKYQV